MKKKVLNLYAGIGGNRKLWENVDVTAIENNPKIAKIYRDFFPKDKVIIEDAHPYLLNHFEEYDFIWSSPPCPTHSRIRKNFAWRIKKNGAKWLQNCPIYPDMKLYEEILLLKHYFSGVWVVENVISFYEPLIECQRVGRHYFWSNFYISNIGIKEGTHFGSNIELQNRKGFNLNNYEGINKKLLLRNCVEPELGLHIFNSSLKHWEIAQYKIKDIQELLF